MNTALAEAAQARVDEVLPLQEELHALVGFPADAERLVEQRREARAKGGRPPGARNRRLDEVARQVRERFGDVLLQQVAIATMPLDQLLALGLKPLEALQEKRLSAATVLPYIEQKRPIAVDVTGRQVVHLSIEIGAEQGQQDQGVIDGLVVQLDSVELDGAANPLTTQVNAADGQLIADQAGAAGQVRVPPPPLPPSAAARATPPGGGFRPGAVSHAPATVVSPAAAVFEPTPNQNQTHPGEGGGA